MRKKNALTTSHLLQLSLLALIILLASSCQTSEKKRVRLALDKAEKLMWTHPDSALATLQAIEPVPKHGETKARYALLLTQAIYRNKQTPASDSLIHIATDYYDNSSDSLRKAWANYYTGSFCYDNNRKEEAVKYFQKAECAGKDVGDSRFFAHIYDHWGAALQTVAPHENALRLAMKASAYFKEAKDTAGLVYNYNNIGWLYYLIDNEEKSEFYLKRAADLAIRIKETNALAVIFSNLAYEKNIRGHHSEALEQANLAQHYCDTTDTVRLRDIYAIKAYIFKSLQRYDSARCYIAKTDTSSFGGKAIFHMELSEISKEEGNYPVALFHQEIYTNNLDSFYNHKENGQILELQKKYEYSTFLNENEKLKGKIRKWSIIALSVSLIALAAFFYLYVKNKKREKERSHLLQSKNELINQNIIILQQKENELLVQQQLLQEKEQALRLIIEHNNVLEEKLRKKDDRANSEAQEQLIKLMEEREQLKDEIFHTKEVVIKIGKLKKMNTYQKHVKKTVFFLSEEERKQLYEAVNYTYNNLERNLRKNYPLLTEDDIFVCCLLRMGVINEDICLLTASSEAALKKRKYRIKHDKLKNSEEGVSLDDLLKRY